MDRTEEALLKETRKWLEKLEQKKIEPKQDSKEVKEQITNIEAYVSDCKHFLEKKDFIRAFEAVIYAWGIYDAISNMHLIVDKNKVR